MTGERRNRFNQKLSASIGDEIEAKPNHCFINAIRALEEIPEAEYIEGYAVSSASSEPFLHAWLELDGEIIDPSLPNRQCEYFLGARRTKAEYLSIVRECTKRVETAKSQGPPQLPDAVRKNLSQNNPASLNRIMNPNYDKLRIQAIQDKMKFKNEKPDEFNLALREAEAYQKEQGWPITN